MDLSVPFFGNPNISRQGDKGRQNLKKEYEPSWLDSFLEGFFGGDAPAGSVLDPKADEKQTAKDIGRRAGVVTDLASPVKAGLLGALPALAGAIRVGGAKDLMLSHAFAGGAGESIAKSGFLAAPSLGITSNKPSTFDRTRPELVFRAGAVHPEGHPSVLLNRDGWFTNPHGMVDSYKGRDAFNFPEVVKTWDYTEFQRELKNALKSHGVAGHGKYSNDLRLGQVGGPHDYSVKNLAIALSPKFNTFEEFEKSAEGAQLLRMNPQEMRRRWEESKDFARKLAETNGNNPNTAILDRLARGEDPKQFPSRLKALYDMQRNAPSDMAELKIFDKLDLNPADAFVYVGGGVSKNDETSKGLQAFADRGYQLLHPQTAMNQKRMETYLDNGNFLEADRFAAANIPRIANDKGTFSFPQRGKDYPSELGSLPRLGQTYKNPYEAVDLDQMMQNARTGGGSTPLEMLGAPRISDASAQAAEKILGRVVSPDSVADSLKAAELLQPGLLPKVEAVPMLKTQTEDVLDDLYMALRRISDPHEKLGTFMKLLDDAVVDLRVGKVPFDGPPAPKPALRPAIPPNEAQLSRAKASESWVEGNAEVLYDIAKSFADQYPSEAHHIWPLTQAFVESPKFKSLGAYDGIYTGLKKELQDFIASVSYAASGSLK